MKNLNLTALSLILFTFSQNALSSPITVDQIIGPPGGGLTITNGQWTGSFPSYQATEQISTPSSPGPLENKTFDVTSNVALRSTAFFDFAISGGSVGQYPLLMNLPNKAVITNVIVDVITAPVGGNVSFGAVALSDMMASNAPSFYLGGYRLLGKQVAGSTANPIKLAAATGAFMNILTTPLTAGKFAIAVDYFISQ